jgi:serine/threonine protein kinase
MGAAQCKEETLSESIRSSSRTTRSFHEGLLRERDKKHSFDDYYEVIEEIGHGGLCRVFKIEKRESMVGGSSRPELVRARVRRNRSYANVFRITMPERRKSSSSPKGGLKQGGPKRITSESAIHSNNYGGASSKLPTRVTCKTGAPAEQQDPVGYYFPEGEFAEHFPSQHHTFLAPMYFALKEIDLTMVAEDKLDQLKNEVEILKTLDHMNIIKAYETFQAPSAKRLMIVMELCTGGDLHARFPYTEDEAAHITQQILSAVSYMHAQNIIHRDLKLENIMFEDTHPDAAIKVIDFGLSKEYSQETHILSERVGTLYSMSPETMLGDYTSQADLWSIGVITYMLLAQGQKPFEGKTPKQMVAKVLLGKYSFEDDALWESISDQAKQFIGALLVVKPEERLTATQAMQHAWLHSETAVRHRRRLSCTDEVFKERVLDAIVEYADSGEFLKLALNVIAKKSTTSEIYDLRKVFREFDTRNTGTLDLNEFKAALARFNYAEADVEKIFHKIVRTKMRRARGLVFVMSSSYTTALTMNLLLFVTTTGH